MRPVRLGEALVRWRIHRENVRLHLIPHWVAFNNLGQGWRNIPVPIPEMIGIGEDRFEH